MAAEKDDAADSLPFWRRKKLAEMTAEEWESLCDGCGRCCMSKIEDEDTGDIYETSIACRLLDGQTCRCCDYAERQEIVHDCIQLTPDEALTIPWLPEDCAYRLIANGKKLKWWHYLVSGSRDTVHEAGISVRGKVRAHEDDIAAPEDYADYITRLVCRTR